MKIYLNEYPETIEGKEPCCIWFDGGRYFGLVDRGESYALYTWDGMADAWITRDTYDKAIIKEKIVINIDPDGF